MNITKISPLIFRSRIIDAHVHTGMHEGHKNTKEELDVFVKSKLPNRDKVETMLVSDLGILHGTVDEYAGNSALAKTFVDDSGYMLLASCNPKDGNIENIKRVFKENPHTFAGLKFHPLFQELELTSEKIEPYMRYADRHNLPCLFHTFVITDKNGCLTEPINEFSDPEILYQLAKKHRQTPVVMAHMGAGWKEAHDKAIDILIESVKNKDANLYADISWVDIDSEIKRGHHTKEHIIKAIKRLKGIGENAWKYGDQSFRLMFGSDAPLARFNPTYNEDAVEQYTKFIDDIKYAIRADKDLKSESKQIIEDLFYNNARKLYILGKRG